MAFTAVCHLSMRWGSSRVLTEKIAKIGENITIRRFAVLEIAKGGVFAYKHGNGKIGVLVSLESEATVDSLKELGKDIAMQSASMNPKYIYREDVDSEYIEKERRPSPTIAGRNSSARSPTWQCR